MSPDRIVRRSFWCGAVYVYCLWNMFQDAIGKEKYMQYVDEKWVNTSWIMWLVFAVITYGYFWYITKDVPGMHGNEEQED